MIGTEILILYLSTNTLILSAIFYVRETPKCQVLNFKSLRIKIERLIRKQLLNTPLTAFLQQLLDGGSLSDLLQGKQFCVPRATSLLCPVWATLPMVCGCLNSSLSSRRCYAMSTTSLFMRVQMYRRHFR